MRTWAELKNSGSSHYKTGGIEPIDLYREFGAFRDFALCSIAKYAFRNIDHDGKPVMVKDMKKIIHYAELLMAAYGEEK